MQKFSVIYLRESLFVRAEEVMASDVIAAVRTCAGGETDLTVEVWSGQEKVAVIRPSVTR